MTETTEITDQLPPYADYATAKTPLRDTAAPDGPIAERWDRRRFEAKLVNPANRRKHTVIVVGTGLAGGAAGASWGTTCSARPRSRPLTRLGCRPSASARSSAPRAGET